MFVFKAFSFTYFDLKVTNIFRKYLKQGLLMTRVEIENEFRGIERINEAKKI